MKKFTRVHSDLVRTICIEKNIEYAIGNISSFLNEPICTASLMDRRKYRFSTKIYSFPFNGFPKSILPTVALPYGQRFITFNKDYNFTVKLKFISVSPELHDYIIAGEPYSKGYNIKCGDSYYYVITEED